MQGKKAYILPLVAALLLVGWWIFGPNVDKAAPVRDLPAVVDAQVGTAVQACRDAHPDDPGPRSVVVIVGGSAGGKAMVEQLMFEPAEIAPALRSCLLAQVGTAIDAPAPARPLRHAITGADR